MPAQTFSGFATTDASIEAVWSAMDRPETWEGISGVDEVFDDVRTAGGRLGGFKFHSTAMGKQYVGVAKAGPRSERESLTWDISTSEIQGRIIVDVKPANPGTAIEVTMRVESVSMMASFGFPVIAAVIGNGFQETVDDFATSFADSGDDQPSNQNQGHGS